MSDKYILLGKTPIVEPDLIKWSTWFENANRCVAETKLNGKRISTVFLGLDHNFFSNGKPHLFETMIFPECNYCERCSTWKEAEIQHEKAVNSLKEK